MDEVKKKNQECGRYHNLWLYYQNSVQNLQLGEYWKRYIAELALELCGMETDIGNHIINKYELTSCDPLEMPELLKLLKEKDITTLKKGIWSAQIKICLPIIEIERISYITVNYELLKGVMSSEYWDEDTGKYNMLYYPVNEDDIGNPYELDLATLQRMSYFKKRLVMYGTVSLAPFIRIKENDKKRIAFISDLLNRLSHFKLCRPSELDLLFTEHEKFMVR